MVMPGGINLILNPNIGTYRFQHDVGAVLYVFILNAVDFFAGQRLASAFPKYLYRG
jgi:hypothetical protein